ncbi:hypothetical protein LCGC14_1064300 [marine sediment metagenome]|uniref:DNA-packaging protein gp3 n=2 Tax=root TaxID=1 RepID=A0A831VQA7_9FLAO|nr:hypothetical protein [Pricia sp.]HEA22756.1 hypothetical protein [Pricia antarctica]
MPTKKTKVIRDKKTGRILGSEKGITPDELMQAFEDYCIYVKANPKFKEVPNTKTDSVIRLKMEVPITKSGFMAYCMKNKICGNIGDIIYNRDERYNEFKDVSIYVDVISEADCFDGATAGIFNHAIVIRKLGLADKQEVKNEEEVKITFVKPKQNDKR